MCCSVMLMIQVKLLNIMMVEFVLALLRAELEKLRDKKARATCSPGFFTTILIFRFARGSDTNGRYHTTHINYRHHQ